MRRNSSGTKQRRGRVGELGSYAASRLGSGDQEGTPIRSNTEARSSSAEWPASWVATQLPCWVAHQRRRGDTAQLRGHEATRRAGRRAGELRSFPVAWIASKGAATRRNSSGTNQLSLGVGSWVATQLPCWGSGDQRHFDAEQQRRHEATLLSGWGATQLATRGAATQRNSSGTKQLSLGVGSCSYAASLLGRLPAKARQRGATARARSGSAEWPAR